MSQTENPEEEDSINLNFTHLRKNGNYASIKMQNTRIPMPTHHHRDKVKLTVECSFNERSYIKMLAAKKNMTISELLLASVREKMPPLEKEKEPNAETIQALQESRDGHLESYKTLADFWNAMGIDPNA